MRFIVKEESGKTEKLASKITYDELKEICHTKNKSLIKDSIYRDSYNTEDGKRSHVEDRLAISYKNKCAYCETLCKADIEHYRPKKEVAGENDHEGYYWLCYEWSNLIPSCITCNREGAKHNKFPIVGSRVLSPAILENGELDLEKFKASSSPLVEEMPYLLHPEVDKPENYFAFEIDNENKGIRIKGIDEELRGEKTIEICKLNRQELRLDRVERVIDDFKDGVRGAYAKYVNDRDNDKLLDRLTHIIETLIAKSHDDKKTHTLLRKYIVENTGNFNKIVLPFLLENQRRLIAEIFESTLNKHGSSGVRLFY